jgi:quercetin dioxygenase-like cupin family protein
MSRLFVALLGAVFLLPPFAALGEEVPDGLSVEWQGQKPCEKLYEDPQIRIGRCTFPPGAMHVRHSHPGYLTYVLSGGKAQIEDAQGVRQVEPKTDSYNNSPPLPWHELTNKGDTTLRYLVVERKYQPIPTTDQAASK